MSTPVEKMRNQEGGIITVGNSSASIKSVNTVSILVVDDDTTCLSIVAAILKKFQYEVLTVKHARDALCALRIKGGAFDLVVTDVHMPDMNGFELQQAIAREFDLPVVLMSADDQEAVVLKGLDGGAAFFIAKPVSPDDLRDLWQFASMKKKSQVIIEETGSFLEEIKSSDKNNNSDEIVASASSSVNEGKNMNKKDSKRKSPRKEGSHEKKRENGQSSSLKKPKVVWTNALHNRFLEAIRSIGLERAVPKKILEVMNAPGLTRENVASHLQKYRIFLRRVTDASFKLHCSSLDKALKPRLTSSYSLLDRISKLQNRFPGVNIGASFLNQGASSSTLISQSGYGQSRLLSNQGTTFLRSNIGHTNLVNQSNRTLRFAQNNYQANNTSIQGHLSNMSLENLSRSYTAPINFGSTGINLISSYEANSSNLNTGMISSDLINSSVPTENFEFKTTNYVGYNMANLRQLLEPGNNYKKNDGFKSSIGAINVPSDQEFQNNNNANSAINLDQLVQHLEGSSPSTPFHNIAGGKELSDVIADYQKLLPSNQGNVESGGEINHECYSPMFDLADFGIIPSPPPLEESDLNSSFPNEVNIPNQVEQNGGDQNLSSSGFCGSTSQWDNSVPSFEQAPNQQKGHDVYSISQEFGTPSLFTIPVPDITEQQGQKSLTNAMEFGTSSEFNKTLISPNETEDYDFLESFLAPSPYGEDQTLGGI